MAFPTLEVLDPSTPHRFQKPLKLINDGPDITHFLSSKAYRDIGIFVVQLNHAMCPRKTSTPAPKIYTLAPQSEESHGDVSDKALNVPSSRTTATIRKLQGLLAKAASFIEEAPPDPGPRRFGNLSFRKWFEILEERADALMGEFLPTEVFTFGAPLRDDDVTARQEIASYFLSGFGSAQRLDYGTGHELSFLAFLGCLWKLGAFKSDAAPAGEVERHIVLNVIEPYLQLVRKLILTYTLEPAGSHGVWGLDDHSFLPYIFGSAQLTRPIADDEPTPLEGSVPDAPRTGDIVKANVVEEMRKVNMYFSAVGFVNDVKKGPFWEHSPVLYDISGVKDGWGKINKGMMRMFNAEVLSKFPVVQHFPFGSLFSWEINHEAKLPPGQSVHITSLPDTYGAPPSSVKGTAAPWSQAARMAAPSRSAIPFSGNPPASASATSDIPGTVPGAMQHIRDAITGAGKKPESTAGQITVTKAPWAK